MDYAKKIASDLLKIKAVSLSPDDPFTWASGMKSPIYCDNRLTLGYPAVRRQICNGFANIIVKHKLNPDVIAGTATAGIAHAAFLAEMLDLPMAYIRSKPKKHGQGNQIEGKISAGQKVLIVEDLVSTGGSSINAAEAVISAGAIPIAVVAIFTYGLPVADTAFETAKIPLFTLTEFSTLQQVAIQEKILSESHLTSLQTWQNNPQEWSDKV